MTISSNSLQRSQKNDLSGKNSTRSLELDFTGFRFQYRLNRCLPTKEFSINACDINFDYIGLSSK